MNTTSVFLNKPLQNDNIFVNAYTTDLGKLTGLPVSSKFSKAIISEGEIVNVVSEDYGFLENEKLFLEVEQRLIDADINYKTRSINRSNRHFSAEYILDDPNFHVDVLNGGDKLTPMIKVTNSYAGGPTSGSFGFYRQVCSNGLNIAQMEVGFKVRHKSTVADIVIPEIGALVARFMDNEFYTLKRKFEVLSEKPITDLSQFVKFVATEASLFKYEASEKNPTEPSKNAQWVMDLINQESRELGARPNLWIGYNAFNQFIHRSEKQAFESQKKNDKQVFNLVNEMAMAN